MDTLERYLGARCSVAASARDLYIHPNTVRQRLERIQQVTGLDLQAEDLLSLELALKVARLQRVREEPGGEAHALRRRRRAASQIQNAAKPNMLGGTRAAPTRP